MDDEKAKAAYHPFASAEEMHQALKPRDEIAQAQVDAREKLAEIDLSELSKAPLSALAQGDVVLHEGVWCEIVEYTVQDGYEGIRVKFKRQHANPGTLESVWERNIIAHPDETFYLQPTARKMSRHSKKERHPSLVRRVPPRDDETSK